MESNLYTLKKFNKCIIEKLPSIALLNSLGLREGITVSAMSTQPLGGPIVIQVGRRSIAVAQEVAQQIMVKKIS